MQGTDLMFLTCRRKIRITRILLERITSTPYSLSIKSTPAVSLVL